MVEEGAWTHCRAARQRVMIGSAMSTIVTRLMATRSCLGTTCVPCEGCAMGTCVPRVSHVMGPYESPATHPGVSPRRQLMVEGTSGDTYNCPTINSRSKPRRRAICHSQFAHRSSTLMSRPCTMLLLLAKQCSKGSVAGLCWSGPTRPAGGLRSAS